MIRVVVGGPSGLGVEAVVRPIRTDLEPANAWSRDLGAAAGPELEERLRRSGALPLGGAVMTPGGALAPAFVIHVAVMSEEDPQTVASARRALANGLRRAADWEVASLALPPLGLGVGTLQAEDAARALVETLRAHLDEGRPPLDLVIVTASEYEAELLRRVVQAVVGAG